MRRSSSAYYRIFRWAYETEVLPMVKAIYEQDGIPDIPARREAWNDEMDAWIKDGEMPEYVADQIGGLPDDLEVSRG
jgi:hypothetical protein